MSVHAGSILTVGGNNVIDRIQSAGLGDVRLPIETIREVGNRLVVDKIPTEPDFTFTMESLDVSTDVMAWLTGSVGAVASGSAPGAGDAVGTEYKWEDCVPVNVVSPWKDPTTGSGGVIEAGHLIPAYYPTRMRYRFGVTDFATQEVELGGGTFYYASEAPREEYGTGVNGTKAAFTTSDPTVQHRIGGVKPGAVRGRNIHVYVGSGGARQRIASVQSFELEATVDSEVEREMGSEEPTGRIINGTDCTGTIVIRSRDAQSFIDLLSKVTGVAAGEVFGYFNQSSLPVEVQIQNPKDPGTILKTLFVADGIFQPPGTPARVNTPTDFSIRFDSRNGTFAEFKGAKP
jgi:hypothetical protein